MIWLTADTHFDHPAVIQFSNRPFASVEEMNEALIDNWNAVVGPHDEVYHLGDFSFKTTTVKQHLDRLNGKRKFLLLGNHDRVKTVERAGFVWVRDVHYLRYEGKRIWLSHYAHRTWRACHHGSFHAFGHSHGHLPGIGRSKDVGVDCNNYAPVSLDEFLEQLSEAEPTLHHPPFVP